MWGRLSAGLLLTAVGCATNPATGKRQLSLVSESQEIQIGKDSDPAITAQMGGLYSDSSLQRYVREVGMKLAALSERPSLPWSYKLLDDDIINAFAIPGGFVYITRGILGYMNSEAELAAVLGHETGHVTARHSAQQITRSELAQLGLGIGSVLSPAIAQYGQVAATGLQLLFLKYSRENEAQADELGFRYMTRVHYDPHGMSDVMRMLQSTEPAGGSTPDWLQTHPDPGNRVQANEQRITEAKTDFSSYATNHDAFLQKLDNIVFGSDPRQGYFLGGRFIQPTLKLEITFPAGWQTANTSQAVQAQSQQGDAAMQLTFANASSPADAVQKLQATQGLSVTRTYQDRVNGMDAQFVDFDLQSQNGNLRGSAMYVQIGSSVYEIVGYASPANWSGYSGTVSSALHSFAQVSDAHLLDVAPDRVQIVRLPHAMTFTEFTQQYPSSVPVDQVRLANQVTQNEQLAAGRLMKRITGGRVPTR